MTEIIKLWEINWSEEMETGHEVIDNFHKSIADKANKIYCMCTDPLVKPDELNEYIKSVEDLFFEHLTVETELYEKHQVSCENEQKELHQAFIDTLEKIKKDYSSIIIRAIWLNQLIVHYLKEHLPKDMECIAKVREKNL